jgi:hypothetical protein
MSGCATGEEALRYQVERLLDSVDAVCYLLDYTKLRTAEEASIFERIKTINPGLVKRLSRRCAHTSIHGFPSPFQFC